nr:ARID DNA-binding domain-containing protein [Tanacetum cinerariifolium]
MVHYKRIMQHNWLGYKGVQQWYQSHGSEPSEKPIHKHDQVVRTRRYLQRETPKRLFPWNSRKKSLSLESKEMLVKKMKEVEAFNASKMSAKTTDHGKKIASTRKEKSARCYICKERGHVFWKCQNKKKDVRIEKQKKLVKPTNKNVAEKIKYSIHVITKYIIEGNVTVEAREGNFVIPDVHYTPEVTLNVLSLDLLEEQGYKVKISNNKCNLHYMFDEARTIKAQEERFTEDDGLKDFLDEYFESIDPKEDCSLVNGLEDLKWDRNDIQMIEKEETEKKFIFSYGVGNVTLEAREGNFVIPDVHYTPEVTLNVLSLDLLEEQGYKVKISNNKCNLHYMFDEARIIKAQEERFTKDDGLKDVVTEHNKFLDEYFESIDPKEDCSLVNGLEDLKWDRNDIQDYVDEEYIIDIVDSLGGYLCVTLGDKWKTIANLQGLTKDNGEVVKGCYKKSIDMVQVYYETAKMPWYEKKSKEDVVESSSGNAIVKDPQGKEKDDAGIEEALEEDMNKKTQFGVKLEGNVEKEAEEGSTTDSNDFIVNV